MKEIPGYEGRYAASPDGRIFSLNYRKSPGMVRELTRTISDRGYAYVDLGRNSRQHIHRLISLVFIGECPPGMVVNHKNGVKTDNRVENLEYVTPSQNARHAIDILGVVVRGDKNGNAKLTNDSARDILQRRRNGVSARELAQEYGISSSTIIKIVAKINWAWLDTTS